MGLCGQTAAPLYRSIVLHRRSNTPSSLCRSVRVRIVSPAYARVKRFGIARHTSANNPSELRMANSLLFALRLLPGFASATSATLDFEGQLRTVILRCARNGSGKGSASVGYALNRE